MHDSSASAPHSVSSRAPRGPVARGWWHPSLDGEILADAGKVRHALFDLTRSVVLLHGASPAEPTLAIGGAVTPGPAAAHDRAVPIAAFAPPQRVRDLGDAAFCSDHGIRHAYMTGAMANGIGSVEVVAAAARAGVLGSFGAAGLRIDQIAQAVDRLEGGAPRCFNLIHSPNESAHEMAVVELYLRRQVRLVEAAAFLDLTLPAVLYRVSGIHRDGEGRVVTPNRVIAKVSRTEVATKWMSPPPEKMLAELVKLGRITAQQAAWARQVPMAQDITAEADSAGHTDNRPALTLLPTMLALRDRLQPEFGYAARGIFLRVGLGGGIGTPAAAAAAFAMGAAYIVTGSVNQACVESGSSDKVRQMLAEVQQADVIMAPAADMFEMGVKLQVSKRGTMFAMRAAKLWELYRAHESLEAIPAAEREAIEKTIFRERLTDIWEKTKAFFREIDPTHIERAEKNAKHKMALVFRWYLGLSSRWANSGEASRVVDYQIWCGPAMGAFNEWATGSFLEEPGERKVGVVAMNLMWGAACFMRVNMLRAQGVPVEMEVRPRRLEELELE